MTARRISTTHWLWCGGGQRRRRALGRSLASSLLLASLLPQCARKLEGLECPCADGYSCCDGRCSLEACNTPGDVDAATRDAEIPTETCCPASSLDAAVSPSDNGSEPPLSTSTPSPSSVVSSEGTSAESSSSSFELTGETSSLDAFSVVEFEPADGAREVSRALDAVHVRFANAVDPETVDPETVRLTQGSEVVPVELTVQEDTIRLSLLGPLRLFGVYTVHVGGGVADVTGAPLGKEVTASFVTRQGAWVAPEVVDDPVGLVGLSDPRLGAAGNGDILALFTSQVGTTLEVPYARWHRAASGWEEPVAMEARSGLGCRDLALDVSLTGNALAAWNCAETAKGRPFRDGSWEAQVVQSNAVASGLLVASMRNLVAGFLSFSSEQGANLQIEAVGDDDATPTHTLTVFDHTVGSQPSLAFDEAGNGLAVWTAITAQGAGTVAYGRYAASSRSWMGPSLLLPDNVTSSIDATPAVAMDPDGNAMALWAVNSNDSVGDIFASRFTKAEGWQMPVRIDQLDGQVGPRPRLVFDGQDFVAAYYQDVGLLPNIYRVRYSNGAWGTPELAGTELVTDVFLATDKRGTSILAWADAGPPSVIGAEGDAKLGAVTVQRYSPVTNSWANISPSPPLMVFGRGMSLTVAENGTASLGYIRFTHAGAYTGAPTQFEDFMLTRFE